MLLEVLGSRKLLEVPGSLVLLEVLGFREFLDVLGSVVLLKVSGCKVLLTVSGFRKLQILFSRVRKQYQVRICYWICSYVPGSRSWSIPGKSSAVFYLSGMDPGSSSFM